jgi:alkylation response protein AidB-like acyl-CoA dehydrogenase
MDFSLSDDQKMLQESASRFIEKTYTFEARKNFVGRDGGFSAANWKTFAELGWLAVTVPEAYGGLGGSAVETALLMQEFGKGLVVEPFVASAVLATKAIIEAGSEAQKEQLLGALAAGETIATLAHGERHSRGVVEHVETTAKQAGKGWRLDGVKTVVLAAGVANLILVPARTAGAASDRDGITLFAVDAKAPGVSLVEARLVDGSRAADVKLDGVEVGADAVLGQVGKAWPALQAAVDEAIIAICAEAVGGMDKVIWTTRDYLKTRKQFGVAIGSFQALQHRMADMVIEHEMASSMLYRGLAALQNPDAVQRSLGASAAKAQIMRAAKFVTAQGIQLHGGMGMTEEYLIGHYFKRVVVMESLFGSTDYHVTRYARALQHEAA